MSSSYSNTNQNIYPNLLSISIVSRYIGTLQQMSTGMCLLKRSIFVLIESTITKNYLILLLIQQSQQQPDSSDFSPLSIFLLVCVVKQQVI